MKKRTRKIAIVVGVGVALLATLSILARPAELRREKEAAAAAAARRASWTMDKKRSLDETLRNMEDEKGQPTDQAYACIERQIEGAVTTRASRPTSVANSPIRPGRPAHRGPPRRRWRWMHPSRTCRPRTAATRPTALDDAWCSGSRTSTRCPGGGPWATRNGSPRRTRRGPPAPDGCTRGAALLTCRSGDAA
jgi:hypothetical protein